MSRHEPVGFVSLKGKRFGYWKVGKRVKEKGSDGALYECACDCGTIKIVMADSLRRGSSLSCGCSQLRQFCPKGHDTHLLGRTSNGTCRKCLRHKRLLKTYGISIEEFEALWSFQNGRCAICGRALEDVHQIGMPGWDRGVRIEVDHDHNPDLKPRQAVRGLLCGGRWKGCNRRLGNMDNKIWLRQVLAYLENPPAQQFLEAKDGSKPGG